MVKEGYKEVRVGPKTKLIPEEWKVKKLKKVIKKRKGKRPNKLFDSKNGENSIPYLSVNYLRGNDFPEWCSKNDDNKVEVKENEILMIWDGSYSGNVFMGFNGALSSTMARLKCEDDINNQYLFYQLRNNFKIFQSTTIGTSVPHVAGKIFENLNIPTPPKREQKKIASILSSVDRSIEKTDEVIEETKELKKGLMQELFTRGVSGNDLRLSPHENNDLYKNSYLGFVPEDWIDYQISDIAETDYGLNSAIDKTLSKGIKMISVGNVNKDGTLDFDDVNYAIEDKISSEDILLKGDILFNWRNGSKEHLGKTIYFDLNDEFTHVGLLIRIRTNKNENIYSKFLYYFMRYIHFKQFFTRAKKQVNNTFNKTELNNLQVFIPPLQEQKKIASILSSVDAKIKKEEEYKAKLEKLKKGLMQKLLTGEIRVNTDMEV